VLTCHASSAQTHCQTQANEPLTGLDLPDPTDPSVHMYMHVHVLTPRPHSRWCIPWHSARSRCVPPRLPVSRGAACTWRGSCARSPAHTRSRWGRRVASSRPPCSPRGRCTRRRGRSREPSSRRSKRASCSRGLTSPGGSSKHRRGKCRAPSTPHHPPRCTRRRTTPQSGPRRRSIARRRTCRGLSSPPGKHGWSSRRLSIRRRTHTSAPHMCPGPSSRRGTRPSSTRALHTRARSGRCHCSRCHRGARSRPRML